MHTANPKPPKLGGHAFQLSIMRSPQISIHS